MLETLLEQGGLLQRWGTFILSGVLRLPSAPRPYQRPQNERLEDLLRHSKDSLHKHAAGTPSSGTDGTGGGSVLWVKAEGLSYRCSLQLL